EVADRVEEPAETASLRPWRGGYVVLASGQVCRCGETSRRGHVLGPSCEVHGVVTESLVIAGDECEVDGHLRLGAFGETFVDQAGREVVELVVGVAQPEARIT